MNVIDAVKSRRTVRRFLQEPVEKKLILEMIDAARLSPSAGNVQSLKYIAIDSYDVRKAIFPYVKYAGYIPDWNPDFEETPTAFIAVLSDTAIRKTNAFTDCDSGIAMMAISLVACELGLDSCILGAIDKKEISEILGIAPEYELLYLIGIGKANQVNTQYDDSTNVKYLMDDNKNFKVPKRKLEDIVIEIGENKWQK